MLAPELGRVAVQRAERQARVEREGGRLATERALRDDRDRPQERER